MLGEQYAWPALHGLHPAVWKSCRTILRLELMDAPPCTGLLRRRRNDQPQTSRRCASATVLIVVNVQRGGAHFHCRQTARHLQPSLGSSLAGLGAGDDIDVLCLSPLGLGGAVGGLRHHMETNLASGETSACGWELLRQTSCPSPNPELVGCFRGKIRLGGRELFLDISLRRCAGSLEREHIIGPPASQPIAIRGQVWCGCISNRTNRPLESNLEKPRANGDLIWVWCPRWHFPDNTGWARIGGEARSAPPCLGSLPSRAISSS